MTSPIANEIAGLSSDQRRVFELLRREEARHQSAVIVPRHRDADGAPLSYAQQRLWFLDQLQPESPFYNIPAAVRLSGALDVAALERSVADVVQRHEVLRTVLASRADGLRQVIVGCTPIAVPVADLTGVAAGARFAEALRLARDEARRPFNLRTGPVLRAVLLRLGAEEHVLVLTIHHVAADVWSLGVFLEEIAVRYTGYISGTQASLPHLPVQYADFAIWQRRWLEDGAMEEQLAYWRRQLAGAPPLLQLPTDRPAPRIQTFCGAHEPFAIPARIAAPLVELSRQARVTLFMTLLAGFTLLLSRHARQTDVVVGSPIANRTRPEIEHLIGFFANTLVMRTDLSGNPTFRELLGRVSEVAIGAYAHQDLPFDQLVEALQPPRALGSSPLFQVMFAFQNAPMERRELPGLSMSPLDIDSGMVHFTLTLRMWEAGSGFAGRFEYNTDLFDAATIAGLSRHFQRILAAAGADPDLPLGDMPLLDAAESERLLGEWSAGPSRTSTDLGVDELFAAQAARTPDAPAVIAGGECTYGALDARANRLASWLSTRFGVGPETRVAVCLDRTCDAAVSALAIWKAGGVYVPLDPASPVDRLSFMLADARPQLVITHTVIAPKVAAAATVLCLDREGEAIARGPAAPPRRVAGPGHAAYIIYTSGSTGHPRGVVVTRSNLSHYVQAMRAALGVTSDDRYLHTASFGFSSSVRQLMVPLTSGAAVAIAGRGHIADPLELCRFIKSSGATIADVVPSYWRSWVEALATLPADSRGDLLRNSLRLVCSASEPLLPGLPRAWASELHHGATLVNMLGQTETTGIVATHPIAPHADEGGRFVYAGRPIANTRVYLLDRTLRPVVPGAAGDVYIGGPAVSRGYWTQAALTAERFVPDPWDGSGRRLYRTGDIGRFRPGGVIEFLGRDDQQIKIRGFRIELGEIEAQLASHAELREVAVVAEGDYADRRLVAYVVPRRRQAPPRRELRAFLLQRLPAYMVPSTFVVLAALPRTATNKVDRRALPAPVADSDGASAAPRTPTEDVLVAIWLETLQIRRLGVNDDFFELGGHSLRATQVVSRIRDAFQVEIPIHTLFEAPTVAGLAEAVDRACAARHGAELPAIVPRPRQAEVPLSYAQKRLWLLNQLDQGSAAYVMPAAVRLRGSLDAGALEHALNDATRRHDVLRSVFRDVDGQPVASVLPAARVALPVIDLQHLALEQREAAVRQLAVEESRQPFDLQSGPLVRARLVRVAPDDHVLTLMLHHIVADGWSSGILVRDLATLYAARAAGTPPPLEPPALQYADFASWQRQWLGGDVLDRQLAYWRGQLAGAEPVLALPTDYPRPAVQSFRGARRAIRLSADVTAKLADVSRAHGVTLFMTLVAAFQTLLARHAGQTDISIGTPIAGRTRSELENIVGCFVNTLVLRSDLSRNPRFCELLAQVRTTTLGAYAHQDLPFELLVERLQPERGLSRTPLVQVMFVLQNAPRPPIASPSLSIQQIDTHNGTTKFDLTLGLAETSAGLWGSVEYNTDLFSPETIDRFCAHFERVLEAVVRNPVCRIQELPLLGEEERRDLLAAGRGPEPPYPGEPVHRVVEAHAASRPHAIAVACGDERLTYGEINARANQLAHHLIRRGVGPETVVGVLMERSATLVTCLLGILKAGGAYLPLDPDYPPARLGFMVQDAGVPLLLTQDALASSLPAHGAGVVRVDAEWETIAAEPTANPRNTVSIDHLAYVTYTSGSTGLPKGVAVPHRGVLRLVLAADYATLTGDDCFLLMAPLPFDPSTLEVWGALLTGARLAVYPGRMPAPHDVGEVLARHGVSTLWLTGSLFNAVIDEAPDALAGVRQLLVGGEPLSVAHVRRALARLPGTRLINGYGPTENTTFTTCHAIGRELSEQVPSVPIGRPIAHTQVYLLDGRGQLVPRGVTGELHTGGDGLARGYHNRPGLTAERFVPDPFHSGARLYRTGDLARWLPDGTLECLGRRDHQVKVRGFRIELGEIEAVLGQHPAVRDVAVITRTAPRLGTRLVAYVVFRSEPAATIGDLKTFVRARLPEYMVPPVFVPLDRLPLTPNQKVDRRALPAADEGVETRTRAFVAPRTDVEQALASLWRELLGHERVGIHDDFFDLGGHSLLATQLISRIRGRLRVAPPLRTVFEAPTVAGLAAHVEMLQWAVAARERLASGLAGGQEEAVI